MWSETSTVLKLDGEAHYVRGGKPGYFPKLSRNDDAAFPHPVPLNLWDPFGFTSKMSPERKEKALLAEINNGRLAQIGIIGMISASKGLQVPRRPPAPPSPSRPSPPCHLSLSSAHLAPRTLPFPFSHPVYQPLLPPRIPTPPPTPHPNPSSHRPFQPLLPSPIPTPCKVPGLDSIAGIKPYAGEVMAPFASGDASLPFVAGMLKSVGTYGW